jgi:hypothetical protein
MATLEFHVDLRPRLLGPIAPLDEAVERYPRAQKKQYNNCDYCD